MIPTVFTTLGKISGLAESRITQAWDKVLTKTGQEFCQWLQTENVLSPEQIALLNQTAKGKSDLDVFTNNLKPELKKKLLAKYIQLLSGNLNGLYAALQKDLTCEQKQVVNAYLKTKARD